MDNKFVKRYWTPAEIPICLFVTGIDAIAAQSTYREHDGPLVGPLGVCVIAKSEGIERVPQVRLACPGLPWSVPGPKTMGLRQGVAPTTALAESRKSGFGYQPDPSAPAMTETRRAQGIGSLRNLLYCSNHTCPCKLLDSTSFCTLVVLVLGCIAHRHIGAILFRSNFHGIT
jgi:hypothetical protein